MVDSIRQYCSVHLGTVYPEIVAIINAFENPSWIGQLKEGWGRRLKSCRKIHLYQLFSEELSKCFYMLCFMRQFSIIKQRPYRNRNIFKTPKFPSIISTFMLPLFIGQIFKFI